MVMTLDSGSVTTEGNVVMDKIREVGKDRDPIAWNSVSAI